MIKLLNATMHDQTQYIEDFKNFGFEVQSEPQLEVVAGGKEALELASDTVQKAIDGGYDGLLLGGRTDIMIYISHLIEGTNLKLYLSETERVRDENDRFIFNLVGVTPIAISGNLFKGLDLYDTPIIGVGISEDMLDN